MEDNIMKYLSAVSTSFIALLMLASSSAMAYQDFLSTVNDACNDTVITDCETCHGDGACSSDPAACTTEQIAYLEGEYCYFCPSSTTCGSYVAQDNEEIMAAEAREAVATFQSELMAAFREALMNGGPVNAIGVCTDIAPSIASEISRETGWMVRRVTTRTRNPLGTPEDWELEQLRKFERDLDKNKPPTKLEAYRIKRESGDREYFRYISGIIIPPPELAPCLACHGEPSSIDPAIKDILAEKYPHDRATGYAPGDLRGAFTVKRLLD
jgi:hypothetical protein